MRDFILTFPDEATAKTVLSDYTLTDELGQEHWIRGASANHTRWITRPIYQTVDDSAQLVNTPEKEPGFHVIIRADSIPAEAEQYLVSDPGDIEPLPFGGLLLPEVPEKIGMAQCRLELLSVGVKASDVEASIANIPDEIEREAALIEWEYRTEVRRNALLVKKIQNELGWSDDYVDQRFISASKR